MPEPIMHPVTVGAFVVEVEHWRCAYCAWEAHDVGAVRRHEETCPQRDDALW